MARKIEFMRKSEARIICYLLNATKPLRCGWIISVKLDIDYIYTMKILGQMYNKGWLKTYKYNNRTYYNVTIITPIEEAKERLLKGSEQLKLKNDD